MRARLVTRCGCDREINVPYPAPPRWVVPLHLKKRDTYFNMNGAFELIYDPKRDGLARREFIRDFRSQDDFVWYYEDVSYMNDGSKID